MAIPKWLEWTGKATFIVAALAGGWLLGTTQRKQPTLEEFFAAGPQAEDDADPPGAVPFEIDPKGSFIMPPGAAPPPGAPPAQEHAVSDAEADAFYRDINDHDRPGLPPEEVAPTVDFVPQPDKPGLLASDPGSVASALEDVQDEVEDCLKAAGATGAPMTLPLELRTTSLPDRANLNPTTLPAGVDANVALGCLTPALRSLSFEPVQASEAIDFPLFQNGGDAEP
jgi:hypothetical protein